MEKNYEAYERLAELSEGIRTDFFLEFRAAMRGRNKKLARQSWQLIPRDKLLAVFLSFARLGVVRDTRAAEDIVALVLTNVLKLDFNTEIMDHKRYSGWESYEDDWQHFGITKYQYDHYIPDYVQDPEGSWRISDYALDKLIPRAVELASDIDIRHKLSSVSLALQVCHMRSDLASWFVEGGSRSLTDLHFD